MLLFAQVGALSPLPCLLPVWTPRSHRGRFPFSLGEEEKVCAASSASLSTEIPSGAAEPVQEQAGCVPVLLPSSKAMAAALSLTALGS